MGVYVGMDVHRKRSQVAIVDDTGVLQRNRDIANDPAKLVPILLRITAHPHGLRHRRIQLVLGSVKDARVSCLHQHRVIQAGPAASTALASCPSWRTANAMKIWEKPRNSAKKPTQNRIKTVRWANAYTRSDPDTQNASSTSRIPVIRFTHQ